MRKALVVLSSGFAFLTFLLVAAYQIGMELLQREKRLDSNMDDVVDYR
jgi:hypothetical protein